MGRGLEVSVKSKEKAQGLIEKAEGGMVKVPGENLEGFMQYMKVVSVLPVKLSLRH